MTDINARLARIKALGEEVAEKGKDLNIQTSGGDFDPPEPGPTRVRLVSYIELGTHTKVSALYGTKTKPMARFVFELSGPKHQPREVDGKKYPHLIAFEEPIGTGAKNNYSKLFKMLVQDYPTAKNFVQLLGKAWRAEVFHRKYKVGDQERVAAELRTKESGYSFKSVKFQDPETNELRSIKVDPPLSELQAFLWDYAELEDWDPLYIAGQYDDGGSKNKVQDKIKSADNFIGSPIYNALIAAGREAETVRPEPRKRGAQGNDANEDGAETDEDAPAARGGKDDGSDPLEASGEESPVEAPAAPPAAPKATGKGKGAAKAEKPAKAPVAAPAPEPAAEPAGDEDDGDPLAGM